MTVCGLYFNSEGGRLWLAATVAAGLRLDLGTAHPLAGGQGSLPRRESFGVLGKVFLTSKGTGRGDSFLFFYIVSYISFIFAPCKTPGWRLEPLTPSWTKEGSRQHKSHRGIEDGRVGRWKNVWETCSVLMVLFSAGLYSTWDPPSSSTRHTISWTYKWLFCLGHFESITCSWKHLNWWLM